MNKLKKLVKNLNYKSLLKVFNYNIKKDKGLFMSTGWYDNYKNEIVRNVNDGVASYKSIETEKFGSGNYVSTSTKRLDTTEVYLKALAQSKKKLTPELKQVIDDLTINELNEVIGLTHYDMKTPLGHAIDDMNLEAVQYLMSKGVDTTISGPNQKHILQELLNSNATKKRIMILEEVLKNFPEKISLEKSFDGKYYSIKYLIPLINKNVITKASLLAAYDNFTSSIKRKLIENCDIMTSIVIEKKDEKFYPQSVKDIFFF